MQVIPSFRGFASAVNSEVNGAETLMRTRMATAGATSGHDAGTRFGSTFGSRLASLGAAAAAGLTVALGAGVVAASAFGLKSAASFQQARISLDSMLGSAEKGQALLEELSAFAAKTPFEIPGLLAASRQLLGVGFQATELIPTLTTIGNTAAALGATQESIDGVVRALGQMKGKGRVSAEELRQISEQLPGFSAIEAVAQKLGITTAEAFKQIEKGAVPASVGIEAILEGMQRFPGAAGAMERQSQSLTGVLSTLKDTLRISLSEGLQPILPELSRTIQAASPAIGTLLSGVSVAVGRLATTLLGPLTTALAAIGPAVAPFLSALGGGIGGIVTALTPGLIAIGRLFRDLSPVITSLGTALAPIGAAFSRLLAAVVPLVAPLARLLGGVLGVAAGIAAKALSALAAALTPIVGALLPPLRQALSVLQPVFANIVTQVGGQLAPVFRELGPVLADVATRLGGAFVVALRSIAPVLPDLVRSMVDLNLALLPLVVELLPPLTDLLVIIVPPLARVIALFVRFNAVVTGGLAFLIRNFAEALAGLISTVRSFSPGALLSFLFGIPAVTGIAIEALSKLNFGAVLDTFASLPDRILGVLGDAGSWLVEVGPQVIAGLVDGLESGVSAVGAFFSSLPGRIVASIGGAGTLLVGFGSAIVEGLATGMDAGFQAVASFVSSLPGRIIGLVALGAILVPEGARMLAGFVTGLLSQLPGVLAFFTSLPGRIIPALADVAGDLIALGADLIGGLATGFLQGFGQVAEFMALLPFRILGLLIIGALLVPKGIELIAGFVAGMVQRIPAVLTFVASLPARIVGVFTGLVGALLPRGIELVQGLLLGIISAVPAVISFVTSLPGRILGAVTSLASALVARGRELVAGLVLGAISALPQVAAFLGSLPAQIPSLLGDLGELLVSVGSDLMAGLANGIFDGIQAVVGAIGDVVDSIIEAITDPLGIASPSTLFMSFGVDIMAGLLQGLLGGAEAVISGLAGIVGRLAATLNPVPLAQRGLELMGGILVGLASGLGSIAGFMFALPGQIFTFLGDVAGTLIPKGLDLLAGLLAGLFAFLPNVAGFLASIGFRAFVAVGNVLGTLVSKGVDLLRGFLNGAVTVLPQILGFAASIPGAIVSAIGDVSSALFSAGRRVIGGLLDGIKAGMGGLGSFLGGVGGFIADHKPIATDHLILRPAGLAIMRGLNEAMASGLSPIAATLSETTDLIASTPLEFTQLPDARPVVTAVRNVATSIQGALTDPLGGRTPAVAFADFGSSLMSGLASGIQGRASEALEALNAVRTRLAEAPRTVTSVVGIDPLTTTDLTAMFAPAFDWIHGLPTRIQGLLPGAGNWLDEKAAEAIVGFVEGLQAQAPRFTAFFEGLPERVGDVPGALADVFARTDLTGIGRGVADSLTGGLRVGLDDALALVGTFDPAQPLGRIDLRPAGESTIERFRAGLAGGLATIRDLLAQTETFVRPPDLAPVGSRIMATLTEGLNAGAAQVRAALVGLSTLVASASFAFAAPPDPSPIVTAITAISERLRSALTDPLGLGGPSTVFATYGTQIVDGLTLGIDRAADGAVAVLAGLRDRLAVPLPELTFGAVEPITVADLEARFLPALNWLRTLPDRVRAIVPAGWLDLTGEVGTAALALQASLPAVLTPFADLPARLATTMLDGVRSGLDLISEFVTELGTALTVPETDLRPAGQLVMRDFRLGLDDELNNVRSLFDQLGVVSVELPNLESMGRGWIDTLTDGVRSGFDPLRDVLAETSTLFADTELSTPVAMPAPSITPADLRALAQIRVTADQADTGPRIATNVEHLEVHAFDTARAADDMADALDWKARTSGRH